jgi:hypothetical protein
MKKLKKFKGALLIPKEGVRLFLKNYSHYGAVGRRIAPVIDIIDLEWRPFSNEKELDWQPLLVVEDSFPQVGLQGVRVLVSSDLGQAVILDLDVDLFFEVVETFEEDGQGEF